MKRETGNKGMKTLSASLSEHASRSYFIEHNNSAGFYPSAQTVIQLIEAQVARTPNDEAVRLGDQSVSYCQLNERANQLAARLRTQGAGPDRLVVVYMEHSVEVVCAI